MKKWYSLFCFLACLPAATAQYDLSHSSYSEGGSLYNQFGDFACQYNRIIAINPENPDQLLVTFVFINGNTYTAISYRQERMKGEVEWVSGAEQVRKEGFVDVVTAKLPPHHVVSWKFKYTCKKSPKSHVAEVDKAALMIMNDNMKISKKIFRSSKFKVK